MAGVKSRAPSTSTVERWIEAGYGQGQAAEYKPFMFVRDVPSQGTSSMVKSRITNRTHHYLSRQELKVHLLAEYQSEIMDIREQFALLPWEETQAISDSLGIRHPTYPTTRTPIVLTTDLLLSLRRDDGIELIAVSVKFTKDLTPRNLEKLLLEKMYWARRGIRWLLATEVNIPKFLPSNLEFFGTAFYDERGAESGIDHAEFSEKFEQNHQPGASFNSVMGETINDFKIDIATGHALLGVAVWNQVSRLNISDYYVAHRNPIHFL
ncbi:TnsA endonuclease N-terminal domain-containing protein [Pseudomonas sp. G.S.17]|uniref:TnsA endonuclease N-terminal domain-containing protein n=1 Tax=Pseudomonas sp. G.S.17 TaxID=3137451 RepID=UPI00311C9F23